MTRLALVLAAALLALPAQAQQTQEEASDLLNALLSGLLGFRELSDAELQDEVAEIGGVAFRSRVPLDYLGKEDLTRYLREVFDSEYPRERAAADERTLAAFDLLPAGTDLRALRARLLEENIAGFYDERPGRRRLYAVSRDRRLTPANQVVLAHELRHALQDQYAEVHELLPEAVGDYDDRRLALLSLLEGDATLVMERFVARRLPGGDTNSTDLSALTTPEAALPGVPDVVRDQLVLPYLLGHDFARALWQSGGWDVVRGAWNRPPESTEQVLHPAKFLEREHPLDVAAGYEPPTGRLVSEGVLGELLIRTLLGEGSEPAAAGWGGDRYRVWDVSGRTLLVWRSRWDTPEDAGEFLEAAGARFARSHGTGRAEGDWTLFALGTSTIALALRQGTVTLVSADDGAVLEAALRAIR